MRGGARYRNATIGGTISLLIALLAAGCSKDSPTQPGSGPAPYLGLTPNPADAFLADSLVQSFLISKAMGATMVQNGELWSELETGPGAIDAASLRGKFAGFQYLGLANYYNLRIVDTNQRGVPADLASTAFDDPAMIARVDAVVDTLLDLFEVWPPLAFCFGNEVDAYFASRPGELPAFRALLQHVRNRVHARLPNVPVACCTISPVMNAGAWVGDTLNAVTDLVVYTYYPFQSASDFQHRPPSTFEPDMGAMLARAGSKPLALQEVGYSSSAANASSPAAQADVVRRFRAWTAAQPRSRVLFANWFLMTDWSTATVNTLVGYYGATSPGFRAYLGNLGLRDSLGAAKPAWNAWRGLP